MNKAKQLTPQDFIDFEEGVLRFNKVMGNDLKGTFKVSDLKQTYKQLSYEEFYGKGELLDSVVEENPEGTLDGLIDCIFTVFFWRALEAPYNYELSKEISWLDTVVCDTTTYETDFVDHLGDSIVDGESLDAQTYLIQSLLHHQKDFNVVGAFEEILSSNMSKFAVKGSINVEEEIIHIEGQGRYFNITAEEVTVDGETYIAFKAGKDLQNNVIFASPKLIKCSTFREPELEQFVY